MQTHTFAVLTGLCPMLLMTGCVSQHSVSSIEHTEPLGSPIELQAADQADLEQSWHEVFAELLETPPSPTLATQRTGPTLVAGDWLAIQCAIAGGYWDMPTTNNAPVFAEALESWPYLE